MQIKPFLLVFSSSVMVTLVSPNPLHLNGLPIFAIFALIPLFLVYYNTPKLLAFMGYTALWGAMFSLMSNYWLYFFQDMKYATLLGTALGVALTSMVGTLPLFWLKQAKKGRAILVAMGWALFEYSRTVTFWAFPWGLMAYSFHSFPIFNQIVSVTGLAFLSFIVAYYNSLLTELVLKNYQSFKKHLAFALALTFFNLGFGFFSLKEKVGDPTKQVTLLLVQQDDDGWGQETFSNHIKASSPLLEHSSILKPDLIVSGEAILDSTYENSRLWEDGIFQPNFIPIWRYVQSVGIPQLLGGPVKGSWGYHNGTVLTNAEGEVIGRYGKQQLVPFAEGMLLSDQLHLFYSKVGLYTGWERGKETTIFILPLTEGQTLAFFSPICFEDAFANLNRKAVLKGAEIFINQTNDSWSRTLSAERQHLVSAGFRSIETHRIMVRAANSGETVVINPHGLITHRLKPFTRGGLLVQLNLEEPKLTFYSRMGNWLIVMFALLVTLYVGFVLIYKPLAKDQYSKEARRKPA